MADEEAGGFGASAEAREQQADASSSDEYDPSQAVQTDFSPSSAQDPAVQPSSLDYSVHNTLYNTSAAPLNTTSTSASPVMNNNAVSDRQSLSRSMSRASSQSDDNIDIITTPHQPSQALPRNTEEVGETGQSGGGSAPDMAYNALDSVSDSSLKFPTNAVPSNNVSIQNDVQDQSPTNPSQNGASNTVPNLAAVIPDTGASFHSEATARPTETLPAPSFTDAKPSVKAGLPTPNALAPRARLPHDKLGILEDRIKDDPRGDLEAWLSLIEEHKRRAKTEDARSVYERFLAVFPSAVRCFLLDLISTFGVLTMLNRLKNGLPTHRWRTRHRIDIRWTRFYLELCQLILIFPYGQCI